MKCFLKTETRICKRMKGIIFCFNVSKELKTHTILCICTEMEVIIVNRTDISVSMCKLTSRLSVLENVSLLIREGSSVLTDWYESPGNYTSVESLTASLIPLNMRVVIEGR